MKIAMCAPADLHALARFCGKDPNGVAPGLGSTATTPLIEELLRRGHEVTLFTLSNGLEREAIHKWDSLRVFAGPSRQYGAARNLYKPEVLYLRKTIHQERPAFVHAHWTYEFALGAMVPGIRLLTTIHDLPWNVLRYFRDRSRAIRLLIAYSVALRCRRFTAVSEDAANHFRKYLKPCAHIDVIPNFLSDDIFAINGPPAPGRPFTFGTVLQGWSRRKNASAALKAFQQVLAYEPNARLVMVGTDYEADGPAHRWARQRGLDRCVSFMGSLPYRQMLNYVRDQVDVVVHPSLDEALSMTVLESMALGKPIIAGRSTPGIRQTLQDGLAGLMTDVRDPSAIADAMRRLFYQPECRRNVATNAYKVAASTYRKDVIVPQYEAVYRELEG
jgi:glycosyltransferase involved in cell wall biosynthesis